MLEVFEAHQKVAEIDGGEINYVDFGSGPAVVFLHGFPDGWRLWRHQMETLADAGYRVIAMDQRGFGDSHKPAETSAYEMQLLVGDVLGLMDHAGVEQADIVCHDWGANVGWALASSQPGRVRRFVPIASGHPKFARTIEGFEKSWYVFVFQFEGVAENLLSRDSFAVFRQLVRNHPETPRWIADLERPGALTAAMNWYRANYSPSRGFALPMDVGSVSAPTMGIFGVDDVLLQELRMITSSQHTTGGWRYERVSGAGHWVQLDDPDYVNWLLLDFLGRAEEERA